MTTEFRHILIEQRGPALWITLNRPEVRNAINPGLIADLTAAFAGVGAGGETRAVVLAGAGTHFCAGGDLAWMREAVSYSQAENVADALRVADMLEAVEDCAVPVIGRVHGAALAGGAGLVAACDVVVASLDTRFGFTEARLGIAPAMIAPFVMRKIGPGHARALFVTAERFDAARAMQLGLIHRVTDLDGLDSAVQEVVDAIVSCGPEALRACKQLVAAVAGMPRDATRTYAAELNAILRTSAEGQEGMRAFLEKRAPCFAKS